ncbi:MAG: tyrosine-type recombinase/integrase [Spirochaetales bacterium]|nr:tyrosine-type recombinase/integrase [Spirochaetales bacterium]
MKNMLDTFKIELKNRNYAPRTIKLYCRYIKHFLEFATGNKLKPEERIKNFLFQQKSHEQRRLAYSSIKIFYKLVIKKDCPYNLDKIRRIKRLPVVLANTEICEILANIKNHKHYAIIATLYSSGLRVSEVVNIKVKDLDLQNLMLSIRRSKQNKDRITIISEKLVDSYQSLVKNRKANDYLFTTNKGKKYTVRTVQAILKNAVSKSDIKKAPTCHTLRHSFATHLMENGTDVKSIKNLLGHKNIKTTMIYLHIADFSKKRIKSPF